MGIQNTREGLGACGYQIYMNYKSGKLECGAEWIDDDDDTPGCRSHDRDVYAKKMMCRTCAHLKKDDKGVEYCDHMGVRYTLHLE